MSDVLELTIEEMVTTTEAEITGDVWELTVETGMTGPPGIGGDAIVHNDLPGRDDNNTHPSESISHAGTNLKSFLDSGAVGAIIANLLIATDAVDGTATEIDVLVPDQNGVATGNVPNLWTSVANVTVVEFQGLLTLAGFGDNDPVVVIVPGGDDFGAYRFTPATVDSPWTPLTGVIGVQIIGPTLNSEPQVWLGLKGQDYWQTVRDASTIFFKGGGLLGGNETVYFALHQVEGMLDFDQYVCGMNPTTNVNVAATNPTLEYGECVAGGRVWVNAQTTPAENGLYFVESDLTLTQLFRPDWNWPGNGYFVRLVAPGDPAHLLTYTWTDDDRSHYFRGGSSAQPSADDEPGTWTKTFDPTATSGVTSVNGNTGVVVLDADDIADGTTNKAYTATEQTKLAGVASGATANSSDAALLARANHTGTQPASTITGLSSLATATVATATSDTPVTSSTTLTNDTGLVASVGVGTYHYRATLWVTGDSAGDLDTAVTTPANSLYYASTRGISNAASSQPNTPNDVTVTSSGTRMTGFGTLTAGPTMVTIEGTVTTTSSGSIQVQHSQRTSNGTATTVKAGSRLEVWAG